MSNIRIEHIRQHLQILHPLELQIEDESAQHAGHSGAQSGGGHFKVRILSEVFIGKSLLQRHRLVYDALGDLMHTEIHALAIQALAPDE